MLEHFIHQETTVFASTGAVYLQNESNATVSGISDICSLDYIVCCFLVTLIYIGQKCLKSGQELV